MVVCVWGGGGAGVRSPLNDRLVELVSRQRGVGHVELNLTSCLSPRQLAMMARDPDKQGQVRQAG